jgi:hypothetical protein
VIAPARAPGFAPTARLLPRFRAIPAPASQALPQILALLALAGCAHRVGSASVARELGSSTDALWRCDCEATGLAAGRDAPDGPIRLWVAAGREILGIDPSSGAAELLWEAPRFSRIVRLEAADLDADGADEWLVTLDAGAIRSEIVGVVESRRASVGKPFSGWLRADVSADGQPRLLGQRAGSDAPFRGAIFGVQLDVNGRLVPGPPVGFPDSVFVLDVFSVPGADSGSAARLFTIEAGGQVAERDPRSPRAQVWRSDTRFVGRPVELRREYRDLLDETRTEPLGLPPPPLVADLDGEGTLEVLMPSGGPVPIPILEGIRVLPGGDLRLVVPVAGGLADGRRTPLIGLAAVGAALGPPGPDGLRPWAGLFWTRGGGGLAKPESKVFLFDSASGNLLALPSSAPPAPAEPAASPEPDAPAEPPAPPTPAASSPGG